MGTTMEVTKDNRDMATTTSMKTTREEESHLTTLLQVVDRIMYLTSINSNPLTDMATTTCSHRMWRSQIISKTTIHTTMKMTPATLEATSITKTTQIITTMAIRTSK
jgi:hypothetical protein